MYNSGASESTTGPAAAVPTAILADADEFQDALAASSLASGLKIPVLLNAGGQGLDTGAAAALTNLGVKQVYVVGGSAAVSDQAVKDLQGAGIAVLRIAGTTFDQTANLLAQFEVNNAAAGGTVAVPAAITGLNLGGPTFAVGTSRGDAYQDALASAQILGGAGTVSPLLLNTNTSTASTGATSFLTGHGTMGGFSVYNPTTGAATTEMINGDTVFGGTLAQTPALVQGELNSIAGA